MASVRYSTKDQRSSYLDLIKGIAIILVVVGHCIQYGSGAAYLTEEGFYANVVFKCIYSFHMPLFALVSGYLFYGELNRRGCAKTARRKVQTVLVPILAWGISFYVVFRCDELPGVGIAQWLVGMLQYCLSNLWFLWAVFWCELIILVVHRWCRDAIPAYVLVLMAALVLPYVRDQYGYVYLYPYFVIGYLWHRQGMSRERICGSKTAAMSALMTIAIVAIWIVMLTQYGYDSYVYTSRVSLARADWLSQLGVDLYRWLIGLVGSAVILQLGGYLEALASKSGRQNIAYCTVQYLGKHTMGIYCASSFLNLFLSRVCGGLQFHPFLILVETVIVIGICLVVDEILSRFLLTRRLYLGGR